MVPCSSWVRSGARLVLMLTAFLFWNTITASSVAAQGSAHLYLYDISPNPPYDVTSTYVNGHVTNRYGVVIYVYVDHTQGQVQDLNSNVIGYLAVPPNGNLRRTTPRAVPMSALVPFTTGWLWRIRW